MAFPFVGARHAVPLQRGTPSFRSTPSGASKGRRPSTSLPPVPTAFGEGSVGNPALEGPFFSSPAWRAAEEIYSVTLHLCAGGSFCWDGPGLFLELLNSSATQLLNYRSWVPPQQRMVLQLLCQGGHPGGGSEGHRRPQAEEAGARGKLPPPASFISWTMTKIC
jgi:hypothetical protein